MVEQTLRTSETITHWALTNNLQRTVKSHEYDKWQLACYVMSRIPPTGPQWLICRRVRSHSLMQRKRCGW